MVAVTASLHDLGVAGLVTKAGVTIEFALLRPIVTTGDVVSVEPVIVPFVAGLASLVLPPSPVGNAYRVYVCGGGAQLAWCVVIPDVPSITLGTLILAHQLDPTTMTVTPADPVWSVSLAAEANARAGADNVRIAVDAVQTFTDLQRAQGRANLQAAGYRGLAKTPDAIIAGAITGDPVTSAVVEWPNGTPGVLTITERHSTGAVNAYTITYGNPVTQTYTQPTITRSATGAATIVPQIVVT